MKPLFASKQFLVAKIISGGQTGADRGGLDAAIELGIPHGGWCPLGRLAEDGAVPVKYVLEEHDSADYASRTQLNVQAATATLIFVFSPPGYRSGTAMTERYATKLGKPVLLLFLGEGSASVHNNAKAFLTEHCKHGVLNIAGPRESKAPGIQSTVKQLLINILKPKPLQ